MTQQGIGEDGAWPQDEDEGGGDVPPLPEQQQVEVGPVEAADQMEAVSVQSVASALIPNPPVSSNGGEPSAGAGNGGNGGSGAAEARRLPSTNGTRSRLIGGLPLQLDDRQVEQLQGLFGEDWPGQTEAMWKILTKPRQDPTRVRVAKNLHPGGDSDDDDVQSMDLATPARTVQSPAQSGSQVSNNGSMSVVSTSRRAGPYPWPLPSGAMAPGEVDSDGEWDLFPEKDPDRNRWITNNKSLDRIPDSVPTLNCLPTVETYRRWKRSFLSHARQMHYDREQVFTLVSRIISDEMSPFWSNAVEYALEHHWNDRDARTILHRMAQSAGVNLTRDQALHAVREIKFELGIDNIWQLASRLEEAMKVAGMVWSSDAVRAELVTRLPAEVRSKLREGGWLDPGRTLPRD